MKASSTAARLVERDDAPTIEELLAKRQDIDRFLSPTLASHLVRLNPRMGCLRLFFRFMGIWRFSRANYRTVTPLMSGDRKVA